mgnify:CR=1 FL=1
MRILYCIAAMISGVRKLITHFEHVSIANLAATILLYFAMALASQALQPRNAHSKLELKRWPSHEHAMSGISDMAINNEIFIQP